MAFKKTAVVSPSELVVSRVRSEPMPAGWFYALDQPAAKAVIGTGAQLLFEGWVVRRQRPLTEVRIVRESDQCEVARLQTGLARAGVAAAYPDIKHALSSGFAGSLSLSLPGSYRIEARDGARGWVALFMFSVRDASQVPAKLIFMHIAKTAGNSVNRYLADSLGAEKCAFHIEVDPRWRSPAGRRELAGLAAISGHITFPVLMSRLDGDDYVKATLLREPLEHVLSHLAFIRHLAHPSQQQRLLGHSPAIQAFAAKLAATDFGDRKAVKALVANLAPPELTLVDNLQVRYLSPVAAGERVNGDDLRLARRALIQFDLVGLTERLEEFLNAVSTRMGWPPPRQVPEENRNAERYGIDASNPALRRALEPLIRFDEGLYRYAAKVLTAGASKSSGQLEKQLVARDLRRSRRLAAGD